MQTFTPSHFHLLLLPLPPTSTQVAKGNTHEPGTLLSAQMEMSVSKIIEGGVEKEDKNRISTTKSGYRAFSIDVLSAALYLERLTTPSGVQFTHFLLPYWHPIIGLRTRRRVSFRIIVPYACLDRVL